MLISRRTHTYAYLPSDIYLCLSPVGHILILISRRTHTYSDFSYAVLSLYIYLYKGTYPHTHTYLKLILVPISRKSYKAYTYTRTGTYIYLRSPVGVHRTYAYTEVPLGTTKFIRIP